MTVYVDQYIHSNKCTCFSVGTTYSCTVMNVNSNSTVLYGLD